MKIGYILTTFPSRTETFAAREIEGLRKLDFDIEILAATGHSYISGSEFDIKTFYRPALLTIKALQAVVYMLLRYPFGCMKLLGLIFRMIITSPREAVTLIRNLHTIGHFVKVLDVEKITHIHAYFLSWPSVIALALSITTGRPFSISAHARDIFVEHGDFELKTERAKFITTCTTQGLKYLQENLPPKYHQKLNLCYHGIKPASEESNTARNNNTKSKHNGTVIAVGRLVPKKGFDILLKAFATVIEERPDSRLMIVGDGPEREKLNKIIKGLSLENNVELSGWRDNLTTKELIRRACVLVAPSVIAGDGDRDGIANVILEAFINHTPVITSRLEGIAETAEHDRNVLFVEPGNAAQLASTIKELLDNKNLQNKLSRTAYETAIRQFDSGKNTKKLAELFVSSNL